MEACVLHRTKAATTIGVYSAWVHASSNILPRVFSSMERTDKNFVSSVEGTVGSLNTSGNEPVLLFMLRK